MLKLPQQTEAIIRRLMAGIEKVGDHRRIGEVGEVFMPINVDMTAPRVVSIMQFYIQFGDVMSDPTLDFFVTDDGIYPLTFEMSAPPVYQVAAKVQNGQLVIENAKQFKDLVLFCTEWASNMDQQHKF